MTRACFELRVTNYLDLRDIILKTVAVNVQEVKPSWPKTKLLLPVK